MSVALLAVACAGTQRFDAAERATASSPRGDLAAEYEISGAAGQIAEAKVWMRGAYEDRVDGREMTVIEVVFEIENEGRAPVVLSEITLDSAQASGITLNDLHPVSVEGQRIVAPGEEGEVRAYFAIPQRFDPEDIAQIEVAWALRHEEGTYAQRTPFRQAPPEYAVGYPYPYGFGTFYYDPFLHPWGLRGPYAGTMPPP